MNLQSGLTVAGASGASSPPRKKASRFRGEPAAADRAGVTLKILFKRGPFHFSFFKNVEELLLLLELGLTGRLNPSGPDGAQ